MRFSPLEIGLFNTLAMKTLAYLGSIIDDLDIVETDLKGYLEDFLVRNEVKIKPKRQDDDPAVYLFELMKSFVEHVEKDESIQARSRLLQIHMEYFVNKQKNAPYSMVKNQYINSGTLLAESWNRSWKFDQDHQEASMPYNLSKHSFEMFSEELRSRAINEEYYVSTQPLISHAHIQFLGALLQAGSLLDKRTHIYIFPTICTNYDHLLYAATRYRLVIHDLSTCQLKRSEIQKIANYGDRFSFALAHCDVKRHLNGTDTPDLGGQCIFTINSIFNNSSANRSKYHKVVIHNRDNGYKNQPQLAFRNSDINTLIEGVSDFFADYKLIRFGKMGLLPNARLGGKLTLDTNSGTPVHEPSILEKATYIVGSGSGVGPFCSWLYSKPTLLLNITLLNYTDFITDYQVLALKHIYCLGKNGGSQTRVAPEDVVRMLCRNWDDEGFSYRELNEDEIHSCCKELYEYTSCPRLFDIHPAFGIILGNFAYHRITTLTYDNLRNIFGLLTR